MTIDLGTLVQVVTIALINLALSGDNVIVIGMAAASLPPSQRRVAVIVGGLLAVVLRLVLTLVAELLLGIPFLATVGGCLLVWVAWRLLQADDPVDDAAHVELGVRQAIQLIVIADVTMSLDNVLAVAGTAAGNATLAAISLIISLPLLLFAGGALAALIERFRLLVFIGAAVIAFTGAHMVLDSEPVKATFAVGVLGALAISMAVGAVVPAVYHVRARANRPSS